MTTGPGYCSDVIVTVVSAASSTRLFRQRWCDRLSLPAVFR